MPALVRKHCFIHVADSVKLNLDQNPLAHKNNPDLPGFMNVSKQGQQVFFISSYLMANIFVYIFC